MDKDMKNTVNLEVGENVPLPRIWNLLNNAPKVGPIANV